MLIVYTASFILVLVHFLIDFDLFDTTQSYRIMHPTHITFFLNSLLYSTFPDNFLSCLYLWLTIIQRQKQPVLPVLIQTIDKIRTIL